LAFPKTTKAILWIKLVAAMSVPFLLLLVDPWRFCGRRNRGWTRGTRGM